MVFLTKEIWFPDQQEANDDGLLAIGGDLSPDRLLLAYHNGIFPWFEEDGDIYWFCPPQRMVLFTDEIHTSHTMKKVLRSGKFKVSEDTAFEQVIRSCANVHTFKDSGTWISEKFIRAYTLLHHLGHAHSIEVWHENELVGGMYGVAVGRIFCGESMFSRMDNASKLALIHVSENGLYSLIDCQVPTLHLSSMGARIISRGEFLERLKQMG